MTKSELIERLVETCASDPGFGMSAHEIEVSVKLIIETMSLALARNQRIEVRGFGSFDLNYRKARKGRNPKTGAQVDVAAKYVPHFKAGKNLRERVDMSAREEDCPQQAVAR